MSKKQLYISAEAKGNIAEIRIEGEISSWKNNSSDFKVKVDSLVASGISNATIYINSGGGDCFEANEISNVLDGFTGFKDAKLGALCASAATYISSRCNKVTAVRNNNYMIHKPSFYGGGNSTELESSLKLLKNLEAEYARTYSEKTGLSIKEIEALWVSDYWMNAEEAKAKGFIDEIDGEAIITAHDVEVVKMYKNAPNITASVTNHEPQTINDKMKNLLITALALVATTTDAEVLAKVEELKSKASKADDLQAKLDALLLTSKTEKATASYEKARAGKKVIDSSKDFWMKQLMENFDEANATLEAMPAMVKLSEQTSTSNEGRTIDRSNWTYADYQEKDSKALAELAANDEAKFKELAKAHYGADFKI